MADNNRAGAVAAAVVSEVHKVLTPELAAHRELMEKILATLNTFSMDNSVAIAALEARLEVLAGPPGTTTTAAGGAVVKRGPRKVAAPVVGAPPAAAPAGGAETKGSVTNTLLYCCRKYSTNEGFRNAQRGKYPTVVATVAADAKASKHLADSEKRLLAEARALWGMLTPSDKSELTAEFKAWKDGAAKIDAGDQLAPDVGDDEAEL